MLGTLTQIVFFSAIGLWALIIVVFVAVRIRTSIQRRKYSVKQDGDVSTTYGTRGLH